MIEIANLSKYYGPVAAVRDVALSIPAGQVVGLLGPNGAGKTTTIRMMTGYLPPTSGKVTIDGYDSVTESGPVRRRLGYLPEGNPLYPEMRVQEYLDFRGRLYDLPRAARRIAVDRVLERCWLSDMRRRLIGRLSKGYRQRVGLAAALLHDPPLLILDEPTSGLDPVQIRETRRLIRELAGEHTMILSSHILPEVEVTVDRVVIIARGRIRADGTLDELRTRAGQELRYTVEVQGEKAAALSADLRALPGAKDVEESSSGEWRRTTFLAPAQQDHRAAIGGLIAKHSLLCRELSRESASLEQLFVRLTGADEETDRTAA